MKCPLDRDIKKWKVGKRAVLGGGDGCTVWRLERAGEYREWMKEDCEIYVDAYNASSALCSSFKLMMLGILAAGNFHL